TPSSLLSLRSLLFAQGAPVIPPTSSSMPLSALSGAGALMLLPSLCSAAAMQGRGPRGWRGPSSGAHGRIAGRVVGRQRLCGADVAGGGHHEPSRLGAGRGVGDAGELADLLAD